MTPNALAASKLAVLFVGLAIGLFGMFVFVVLGPRERDGEDLEEGSGLLDWIIDAAMEGWAVTTALFRRVSESRFGDWCFATVFMVTAALVFLPVGLYLRGLSALRKAVRA